MGLMVISNQNIPRLNSGLTVIIPTHNRHALLARTLESLLDLPEITSIIVVDDCSTTPVKVDDPRIRLIRNPICLGEGGAINQGIPYVKTKFLAIVSDDDPQEEDWLPEILSMIKKKPGSICYYPSNIFVDSGQEKKRVLAIKFSSWDVYLFEFMPCLAGVVMDFELIRSYGIHELRSRAEFPNDFLQWLQLSKIGKFQPVPQSYARWQIHPEQTSNTMSTHSKSRQYLNNLVTWKTVNINILRGVGFAVTILRFLQMNLSRNLIWKAEIKASYQEVYNIIKDYPGRKIFLIINIPLALAYLSVRKCLATLQRRVCKSYLKRLEKYKRAGAK